MVQHVTVRADRDAAHAAGQSGFTLIELMIAMSVLLAGIAGILTMQLSGYRATAYSRHATEASILTEAKMEWLLVDQIANLADGTDRVDARGLPDEAGLYARQWSVAADADGTALAVTVSWLEKGGEPHVIAMTSRRTE